MKTSFDQLCLVSIVEPVGDVTDSSESGGAVAT
jgi:hypothetical protein